MSNGTSTVNPSEVGWQFVPQYYTFVNKQPNRLHCFYTKASTFIHGTEGEDGKPCFGQQEIHSKITSIGFQDCKVFIHSVDAQSSANGGIIIQVIGEMSNHGEPWRKFVQTFFLAEQPNGYFVLNDIFRFLKEDSVESDEVDESEGLAAPEPSAPVAEHAPTQDTVPSPAPPPYAEPQPEPVHTPAPAPAATPAKPAEEPPSAPAPEPTPEPQVNGSHEPEPQPDEPAVEQPAAAPSPAPEPPATASPAPVSPPALQNQPLAPAPAPQPAAPAQQPAAAPAAPTPAPAPAAPSAPKTWAHLAAANSKKWGSAVAQEVRGVSEAPAASSPSPAPVPLSGPQSPAPHVTTRPLAPREPHPAVVAAQNITIAGCFVKSVTDNISDAALRTALTTQFGPIKELEILRPKLCAFLEFTHVEAARRAIAQSRQDGGIKIDLENGGQARILVETRKEKGDRPPPRGPPVNGGDSRRGSYRGGRGGPGGGRGRGGPPPQQK